MKFLFRIFLCVIWLFGYHNVYAEPQLQEKSTFVTVADIHFDPFYACHYQPQPCAVIEKLRKEDVTKWDGILAANPLPMAGFREDTNYPLLQVFMQQLKKVQTNKKPQFVLVLGDTLAHNFQDQYKQYSADKKGVDYQAFVSKTMMYMTVKFNQLFPKTDVFMVVGNNDTYTQNYEVVPNGAFLQDVSKTWASLIKNKENKTAFLQSFPQGGYYAISLAHQQKLIILNTVLFTNKIQKKAMAFAAAKELTWLRQQLQNAEQQKVHVMLAYHIPDGVDVLTSFKLMLLSINEFWRTSYQQQFEEILERYKDVISVLLPAHIHTDAVEYLVLGKIPVVFTPSISPIYGNSPAFKVFTYNSANLAINGYETFDLNTNSIPISWKTTPNYIIPQEKSRTYNHA